MPLHIDLAPTLKELDLVAVEVNEGWTVVRRRQFIDLFIKQEPYSSVEVFHHYQSGVSVHMETHYYEHFAIVPYYIQLSFHQL